MATGVFRRPSFVLPWRSRRSPLGIAGRAADDTFASRVDVIARRSLDRPNAGVSLAVARDGKLILARAYGVADRSRVVDVTPGSIFHIASISKNIAAAAVLSLVDQGIVRLDDDVTRYVPAAPTHGQRVTIRQLLNHTSGIFSFTSLPGADANEALDLTHAQILASIKDRALDFAPGTSWRYDNTGFLPGRHGCRTGHGPTLRDVYPRSLLSPARDVIVIALHEP